MGQTPRPALVGIGLQLLGGVLVGVSALLVTGPRMARVCRDHFTSPDVISTILHECRPGENRAIIIAIMLAAFGVVLFKFGRALAKKSGVD